MRFGDPRHAYVRKNLREASVKVSLPSQQFMIRYTIFFHVAPFLTWNPPLIIEDVNHITLLKVKC